MHTTINLTPHNPNLVGLGRFELPTSPLSGVRSNQLSYRPKLVIQAHKPQTQFSWALTQETIR